MFEATFKSSLDGKSGLDVHGGSEAEGRHFLRTVWG